MPRQAGDKRPRLDEDGDQEVLIFTTGLTKKNETAKTTLKS